MQAWLHCRSVTFQVRCEIGWPLPLGRRGSDAGLPPRCAGREAAGQENRRLLEKWAEQPIKGSDDIDFVELVRSKRDAREQRLSRLAGVDPE